MSFTNCVVSIRELARQVGAELSNEDIVEIQEKLGNTPDGATREEIAQAMKLHFEELQARADRKLADDYATLTRLTGVSKQITDNGKITDAKQIRDNILRWLDGGEFKNNPGGNLDPLEMTNAEFGRLQSLWQNSIGKYASLLRTGLHDLEIAKTIDAIEKGLPIETKDKNILAMANAFVNMNKAVYSIKKTVDPTLSKIDTYLVKQFHNIEKMIGKKDEWVNIAVEVFSAKTFGGNKALAREKLGKIYDKIVGGTYGYGASDDYSMLSKFGKDRELIPESPEAFIKYMRAFGQDTLSDSMDRALRETASSIALTQKFGPNRRLMLTELKKIAVDAANPAEARWLANEFDTSIRKAYVTATGKIHAPPSSVLGRITQAIRSIMYSAHGLAAPFRSLSDLAHQAAWLSRMDGSSFAANQIDVVTSWARNITDTNARNEGLREAVLVSHIMRGDVLSNMGLTGTIGNLSKMAQLGSKWSGLNRMTDSSRATIGVLVAKKLGDHAGTAHAKLNKFMQAELARYNIFEAEWDLIRSSVTQRSVAGQKFDLLSLDTVSTLSDEAIEAYARKSGRWTLEEAMPANLIELDRMELGNKIGTMINQAASVGTSTAGTRQLALMFQGTTAGEGLGIGLRLAMQFKSSTVTNFGNHARSFYSGGGLGGGMSLIAQAGVMSSAAWAIGDAALQMLNGKEPEDPFTEDYLIKMAAGSGLGGIWGDIVAREMISSQGFSVKNGLFNAMGPTVGALERASRDTSELGVFGGIGQEAISSVPFVNSIPVLRGAWEFYVANAFKEVATPGSLHKMERRMRDQGRDYLFFKPTAPAPFGVE